MAADVLFLEYPKCSTCQKAKKWLDAHGVAYTDRHIVEDNPTADELRAWHERSGLPLKRLFNTSGMLYREMELSKRLPEMSDDEQYALLATNGVSTGDTETLGVLEAQGKIVHIAQAVVEGNSHFYVKLEDGDNIYDFALPGLIEIVGYKEGDPIAFKYVEAEPTNPVEEILAADGASAAATAKEAQATGDAAGNAA